MSFKNLTSPLITSACRNQWLLKLIGIKATNSPILSWFSLIACRDTSVLANACYGPAGTRQQKGFYLLTPSCPGPRLIYLDLCCSMADINWNGSSWIIMPIGWMERGQKHQNITGYLMLLSVSSLPALSQHAPGQPQHTTCQLSCPARTRFSTGLHLELSAI